MTPSLSLSEMNTLMDIAFLFQSVRDVKLMSQKFLQMLGKIVAYEKGMFLLYQEPKGRFAPCAEIRCGGNMIQDYVSTYYNLDYLGWQIFQSQDRVLRESGRIQADERQGSRFYQEFLRRYDAEYRLILSVRSAGGTLLGSAMLFRSALLEDFSDQEAAILNMLHDHFAAGIENARQLDELSFRERMAQQVYQTIPDVMLLLDEQLNVQEGNQAAEHFLQQMEDFPGQQREFLRTIRACCQEMMEDQIFTVDSSELPGSRETVLLGGTAKISMITRSDLHGRNKHEFVVVFSQSLSPKEPAELPAEPSAEAHRARFYQVLQRQYSLTRRELELIEMALEGLDNQTIAEQQHISLFTVKSHFQNGYAKLGVKNRQELFLIYMKYLISEQFRREFDRQTRKDDVL